MSRCGSGWSTCAVLAIATAVTGCGPHVLSKFGDRCGVNFDPDHQCRIRPVAHDGVDFGPASLGDPVIASADGIVNNIDFDSDSGTEVIIVHRDYDSVNGFRYRTGYAHLERATVKPGEFVRRGDVIGEVGLFLNSGEIVHVHWRLFGPLGPIDPLQRTVGCFSTDRNYPRDLLQLTYPLRC